MNRLKTGIFSLVGLIVLAISCTKEYPGIEELDTQLVQEYIQKNNLTMQQYGQTGIYYQVVRQGSGPALAFNRETPFIYTVKSLDGSYSSLDTFAFSNRFYNFFGYLKPDSLREVLKLAGANQGGIVRVILPSRFAYGKKGSGSIPGNSSLDYSITALTASQIATYDDLSIIKYMASQNLTGFSKSVNGVYYKIAEVGDGSAVISDESTISVQYTGRFLTGKIFEQSANGTSFTRSLGDLIKGWREVLPLIKKGGSVRVIIPSSLAYGMSGNQAIPPFSCLDFDIKVTDVAN